MNSYLIGIAVAFQAAGVLITTRNPYGVALFAVASIIEGLIIWIDRQKMSGLKALEAELALVKQQQQALEASQSQLAMAVRHL